MALKNKFFVSLTLLFPLVTFASKNFTVGPGSSVEFVAVGRPSMLKVHGTGAKPEGNFSIGKASSGDIAVDLNSFTTGMNLRDKHMKEKYLETGKTENQIAHFKIKQVALPSGELPQSGDVPVKITGDFTLHGKTKEMTVDSNLKIADKTLSTNPVFKIKLSDFGIAIPSFAGVTVAEDVDIMLDLRAAQSAK